MSFFTNIKRGWTLLFALTTLLILASHLLYLDQVPRGLHIDEASVAINAITIMESGVDEYGTSWPLYFKAFGEYKNPVYIYFTAGVFKLFGVSIYNLKLTSAIFFILSLFPFWWLINTLFKRKSTKLLLWFSYGFLPQYMAISRVSFEVISQLPATVWMLWCVKQTYDQYHKQDKQWLDYFWAGLSGIFLGFSVYTYSTSRLLSFLFILGILVVYKERLYWKRHLALLSGFALSMIPWVIFFLQSPSTLTNRFGSGISYLNANYLDPFSKILVFIYQYLSYFSPEFLFSRGDPILRHSTGFGGQVFMGVVVLAFLGVSWIIFSTTWKKNLFTKLILTFTLIAPVAGALTWESTPHALRGLLVGFFIVILAGFGWEWLQDLKETSSDILGKINSEVKERLVNSKLLLLPSILSIFIAVIIVWEALNYQVYYYFVYPEVSVAAFESWKINESIQTALDQSPTRVIISNGAIFPYTHLEVAKRIVKNPENIPMLIGDVRPESGSCLVYFPGDKVTLAKYSEKYTDLSLVDAWTGVRCFQ